MKSMGLGEISQTNDIIIPDPYFANEKTDGFTYKWLFATTFMLQELHKELH